MPRACSRKLDFARSPTISAACIDRALRHAGHLGGARERPLAAVRGDLRRSRRCAASMNSRSIQPRSIMICSTPANSAASRPGLTGRYRSQVRAIGVIRGSWMMMRGALLARLPEVVGGDRRALGDVRAGDPDHLGADHVGPRIGGAIDAERLLVGGAGADHAQPAVVVDERRLQADARELARAGRSSRSSGSRRRARRRRRRRARSAAARSRTRRRAIASSYGSAREARRRRRIALQRGEQAVGMRALQIALHALRAQHAAVERKLLPRLEPNHLVVAHLELDAALLAAEAAVRLDQPVRLDAGRQPRAGHRRQVRPEARDDVPIVYGNRCHKAPCARPNIARRHFGHTSW